MRVGRFWPWLDVTGIAAWRLVVDELGKLIEQKTKIIAAALGQRREPRFVLDARQLEDRRQLLLPLTLSLLCFLVGLFLRTSLLTLLTFLLFARVSPLPLGALLTPSLFSLLLAPLLLSLRDLGLDQLRERVFVDTVLLGVAGQTEVVNPLRTREPRQALDLVLQTARTLFRRNRFFKRRRRTERNNCIVSHAQALWERGIKNVEE